MKTKAPSNAERVRIWFLLTNPRRFLAKAIAKSRLLQPTLALVALALVTGCAIVGLDRSLVLEMLPVSMAKASILTLVFTAGLVLLYLGFAFIGSRLFSGKASLKALAIVAVYAMMPIFLVAFAAPGIVAALIWSFALGTIGLGIANGVSSKKAFVLQSAVMALMAGFHALLLTALVTLRDPSMGSPAGALIGKTAPEMILNTFDGKEVALSSLKGKVVVLDFWATWCEPCRIGMPKIADALNEYTADQVQGFSLSEESDAGAKEWYLKQNLAPLTGGSMKSSDWKAYFAGEVLPETVVVGRDGKVDSVLLGVSADEKRKVKKVIEHCLSR